jgi:hypothetical protein
LTPSEIPLSYKTVSLKTSAYNQTNTILKNKHQNPFDVICERNGTQKLQVGPLHLKKPVEPAKHVHKKLTEYEHPLFKIFSEGRDYRRKVPVMQTKRHRRFSFQRTFRNCLEPYDPQPVSQARCGNLGPIFDQHPSEFHVVLKHLRPIHIPIQRPDHFGIKLLKQFCHPLQMVHCGLPLVKPMLTEKLQTECDLPLPVCRPLPQLVDSQQLNLVDRNGRRLDSRGPLWDGPCRRLSAMGRRSEDAAHSVVVEPEASEAPADEADQDGRDLVGFRAPDVQRRAREECDDEIVEAFDH